MRGTLTHTHVGALQALTTARVLLQGETEEKDEKKKKATNPSDRTANAAWLEREKTLGSLAELEAARREAETARAEARKLGSTADRLQRLTKAAQRKASAT